MKIGDLWVKLGLKKDEFSRGMKEAGEEASGNNGLLGKIKGLRAGSIAAFAAMGAALVGLADKFAHTSQRLGDQWDQVTAGLKASWRTFVTAVNQTDFSNIGQRLANAFRNAKEIAASSDLEFEVMNSINLRKSEMSQELESLRVLMQNQKLTQQQRIAAAEEYLAKLRPIYAQEEAYRKAHANTMIKGYLENAQLDNNEWNARYLRDFLVNIAPDTTLTDALFNYNRNGWGNSDLEDRLLKQLRSQYGGNELALEALGKIADHYKSTYDTDVKPVVDAIMAANYAAGAFDQETRRVQSIANQSMGGGGSSRDTSAAFENTLARALMNIEDEVDRQIEQMDKDLEKENKSIKLDPIEVVPPDFSEWDEYYTEYQKRLKRTQDLVDEFKEVVATGFSDAIQELFNQFAGLEDINPGRIVQALLTPLADMAIKEGEILIATGLGVEAVKEALKSLQGPAAIVAGAALIAVGAAAKSGLAALANTGGRSTSTTTAASSASSAGGTQDFKTEMTVYVKGTIRGSDIVLSGQNTVNGWKR